jgi:hypothetical protein
LVSQRLCKSSNAFFYKLAIGINQPNAIVIDPDSCHQPARIKFSNIQELRVGIVGSAGFDIKAIEQSSLRLNGEAVSASCNGLPSCVFEDLPDGSPSLLCKFGIKGTSLQTLVGTGVSCGNIGRFATLTLTGISAGVSFSGTTSPVCVITDACSG